MISDHQILLVEDEDSDAEIASRILRRAGVTGGCLRARDGEQALEFLHGSPRAGSGPSTGPALRVVLLDLKLPKVDGIEVLERIRAHPKTRALPVVIFTSSVLPADIEACYKAGANSFIAKQVAFESQVETITAVARYWLQFNIIAPGPG